MFLCWASMLEDLRHERLEKERKARWHWRIAAMPFLRVVFQRWRNEMRISQRYELAARASQTRLLVTAVRMWRLRVAESHEHNILLEQARCFRNMHLRVSGSITLVLS